MSLNCLFLQLKINNNDKIIRTGNSKKGKSGKN